MESLVHLYVRVLRLLGAEARVGWLLALASLEGGRVVEQGTFRDLAARGGRFTELASAQFLVAAS